MADKKVALLIGKFEFIGAHLTHKLLNNNYVVHVLDNKICTNLPRSILKSSNFFFNVGDYLKKEILEDFFIPDADIVFNLTGPSGVKPYVDNPFCISDAVLASKLIIDLCFTHNIKMVFLSTSEIYGKNLKTPWSENDDRVLGSLSDSKWGYAASKTLIEQILFGLNEINNFPFVTIRLFNTYGPRQEPNAVISASLYKSMKNQSPQIYNGGLESRCFTYIDDVIEGIFLASESHEANGHAFNIASNQNIEVCEVVNLCIKTSNFTGKVENIKTETLFNINEEDIINAIPDSSKAEKILGWKPKISLNKGIELTYKWINDNKWYLD